MLLGSAAQVWQDNMTKDADNHAVELTIRGPEIRYSGKVRDDLTGQTLHDGKVAAARATELSFFDKKGVWKKVPRSDAIAKPAKHPSQ